MTAHWVRENGKLRDTPRVNFIAIGHRRRKRRRSIPFKSSIKTLQFNFNSMAALDRLRWSDEVYLELKVYRCQYSEFYSIRIG